ncbi:hypothetical protein PC2016_3927 (plasmid) [Pseudoalteromonas carrageenovora]|uniref:Uncharacterized protein n=1 Tax=Pseudoalteromonas carrageenovora IAM 12662 TaxID=1314868 RepID=A0A2K4XG20_PSEVC|nr:hypothetical protein [Pseudoalteromonas carrageenovora]MBE0381631.1 hypothetical protein [Pseudoalteromonas carrageenovora IAM 12662]MDO6638332.1 hypothetical protein [Pseudoalteromonas carrageenovora]MDO6650700.1 hypothetical protein [Pseudoalteromonas carrageenovora]QBJ74093.1 hypothetical protein PC2016_3927 [Pseudoalteromonas carrageenovora]SOU43254.1 Putative protein of unknown function [Pseudoalteromonas carrageenovora IAM 12662]
MKNNDANDIAINPTTGLPITNASANIVDVGGNVIGQPDRVMTVYEIEESIGDSIEHDYFDAFDDGF